MTYAQVETALLTLGEETRCTSKPDCACLTHVLMPNMAYACGGNILSKRGHFECGTGTWDKITCPDCRSLGRHVVHVEVQRQQGREVPA